MQLAALQARIDDLEAMNAAHVKANNKLSKMVLQAIVVPNWKLDCVASPGPVGKSEKETI